MIVGFPGETAEDFELTLDLVRRVRFHSMYSFKYSPRPEHARDQADAGRRDGGGEDAADSGAAGAPAGRFRPRGTSRWSGRAVEVLVDSRSRRRSWELAGRTSGNAVVNFAGPPELIGRLVAVRVTAAGPNSMRGEMD